MLDLVVLGIGIFLVFGRLGCHSVACCHGTLGRGVTYGPPHVAVGFFRRWSGRSLWPVQLAEAIASAVLVAVGLAASAEPGRAALVYAVGYAVVRFALELVRGDALRPYARGLSEAQWVAAATALAAFAWQPGVVTATIAGVLVAASSVLVVQRHRRELVLPPHIAEL
ncbi:MAG TPA: prolipoprotein diacylglyceryl transferase family protein, partial [Kofleriaceae bacterium]